MDDDPPYQVAIYTEQGVEFDEEARLRAAVLASLRHLGVARAGISVALVGDKCISELNRSYRREGGPTDVLAFDLSDEDIDGIESRLEGEIVLSVETARREADRRGLNLTAEVCLYAVHGTLHLLGYRDDDERSAAAMHEKEDEILVSIGIGRAFRVALK